MKKVLLASALLVSASAMATAPGGSGCGWGSMLFAGKNGLPIHVLAATTNGITANNTFGMTSGTNGCSTDGSLTYGGKGLVNVGKIIDEFSEDVARGDGEAITAVAVSMGVTEADRSHFKQTLHTNFDSLFPSEDVTTEHVVSTMFAIMKEDQKLAKYVA
ncbi:DUF3015 domain-containing protein [Thalassotalea agarivorans]|uniref:DUF3015 domain-containing protein n=1 Tax=Thalassotalea agarivorans TaxID=349064 RepID=A0A1H9YBD7_THASX|nr:DUF3015 domain-containing protein [Thalassotalea agarivorans]SES66247.1 Protein of unknown function [Thalassotalea agarivorans]